MFTRGIITALFLLFPPSHPSRAPLVLTLLVPMYTCSAYVTDIISLYNSRRISIHFATTFPLSTCISPTLDSPIRWMDLPFYFILSLYAWLYFSYSLSFALFLTFPFHFPKIRFSSFILGDRFLFSSLRSSMHFELFLLFCLVIQQFYPGCFFLLFCRFVLPLILLSLFLPFVHM